MRRWVGLDLSGLERGVSGGLVSGEGDALTDCPAEGDGLLFAVEWRAFSELLDLSLDLVCGNSAYLVATMGRGGRKAAIPPLLGRHSFFQGRHSQWCKWQQNSC